MPILVDDAGPTGTLPGGAAEALRRLAEGPDAVAWAWLAEHEGPAMYRIAARMIGPAAADDACQEALLHIRRGARHFRPPAAGDADAAARGWLLRVASNAAAMWLRSERRRVAREQQEADGPGARRAVVPPAHASGDLDALREALAALPEAQRLPVVLHHLGGHDFIAVAAACGTTPGAARVRAHRGLATLRERLARVGVVVAATSLLHQLVAQEVTVPVGSVARWTTLLSSSTTPAVTSTAIFGGLSIMTKIAIACAGAAIAGLLAITIQPSMAEEHGDKPVVTPKAEKPAEGAPKKEGLDALPAGTKGVAEGTVLSKEKGKLIVHTKDGDLLFAAYWRGGAPKDGGGLDKETITKLEGIAVGDKVRIEWTWEERRRIDTITKGK